MNVLLIPATDWLRHPVPSRQHHVFEMMAETDNVHVLQFDLYPENIPRETHVVLHRPHTIFSKGLAKNYIFNMPFYWKKIIDTVKSEEIDVVVVSNLLPGVPTLLGNLGCKIVFDLKDMFSDNSAIYYKNAVLSSMIRGNSEWLLRRLLKSADHVITVSMFLVNYLREMGIDNVSLVTNGADLSIFKPNLLQDSFKSNVRKDLDESKVIGFVGTIDNWIDFETVLVSFKKLSSIVSNVKLLIVGGRMVTAYFDEIKSRVNKIGLQDRVIFTGIVPHKVVPSLINLMDVCLIPMRADLRLNQARCPDKLFEYLACGKPVVSTRLSEVLRIGQNAARFYDDASSLTRVLAEILQDAALQDSMKKAALDIAEHYDWQEIAKRYREVLEKELAN